MKMRKLLAVVLAVTMAISAMALSAFADTYTIPLYNYTSTNEYTVTYEITVPAYALYGYASQSNYLVLNLPTNLSATTASSDSEPVSYALYDKTTGDLVKVILADEYDAAAYAAGNKYDDAGYFPVLDGANGVAWYDRDASNYSPAYVSSTATLDIDTNNNSSTASDGDYYTTVVSGADISSGTVTFAITVTPASDSVLDWGLGSFGDGTNNVSLVPSNGTKNSDGSYTINVTADDLAAAGVDTTNATLILNWWAGSQGNGTVSSVVETQSTPAYVSTCVDASASTIIATTTYAAGAYAAGNTFDDTYTVEVYTTATVTGDTTPLVPDQVIDYYLTVNGVTVQLQSTNTEYIYTGSGKGYVDGSSYGTFSQIVEIGTFARDYQWTNSGTEYVASVPQSTIVSENTPITITAVIDYSDDLNYSKSNYDPGSAETWEILSTYWPTWSNAYGYAISIEYYSNGTDSTLGTSDDVKVGEVLGTGMSVTKSYASDSTADTVLIVADVTNDDGLETGKTLYWDHTLLNRANIMTAVNTEGTTAQVVVTLEDSITGYAVYTLRAAAESTSYGSSDSANTSLWYSSGTSGLYNTVAGTYVLAGDTTSELVFDIDPSVLYNGTYGVYNGSFWVTQQITAGGTAISSYSDYATHTDYSNGTTYQLRATEVNLVITVPDEADATLEVDDPVEAGDTDSEDDGDTDDITVNEPDVEDNDSNPTTGIVLALVPMAVAAAAAVASKRR